MPPIRVAIADRSRMFVDAIRRLLDSEAGVSVVGAANSGAAAVDLVRHELPDVLLLDTALPDGTCLDVLRTLDGTRLAVRVVLLASQVDKQEMVDAVCLGARGLVLKQSPASLLVKCVRSVAEGEY
jgi:two-component system, NarL family, nitrate/nitrite response regulator NarL